MAQIAGTRGRWARRAPKEARTAKYADVTEVHAVLGLVHAERIVIRSSPAVNYAAAAVKHAFNGLGYAARGLTRVDGRVNHAVVAVTYAGASVTYAAVDVGQADGGVTHADGGVISFVRRAVSSSTEMRISEAAREKVTERVVRANIGRSSAEVGTTVHIGNDYAHGPVALQ